MIGQTVSHYRITAKLGAGGMGEVYLAEDTTLKRNVALKFLPQQFSGDPDARARFEREAKALAALNHPHIVTVFAVSEHDGRPFIAMEYVEGQSLKERIADGDCDMCRVIETAIQIGDGLAAAHEAGVVHRDIKSDNIVVSSKDKTKIMDFGLATWGGVTQLTKEGSTVGTAAYMSPEQSRGQEVDHRTDLWSLGVVLYELVTRRLPFAGDHEAAIAYSIANETPHPLERYSADAPEGLQRIVGKCLAKDRAERYQSAADIVADLRTLRRLSGTGESFAMAPSRKRSGLVPTLAALGMIVVAAGAALVFRSSLFPESEIAPERKMLAVLPFENLGADDQEYFADGITEEITARLAGVQGLGVIARTSILQYKGTQKTVQEIGSELGVEYVLEGAIRWETAPGAPDRVRVTPQLIKVADATHLWAGVYDEDITSVFQVQGDIAAHITDALGVTLLEPERQRLQTRPTASIEAYDFYLRGVDYQARGETDADLLSAIENLNRAVALDPRFAVAFTRLAEAHTAYYFWHDKSKERGTLIWDAIDSAFALQPDLPEAYLALGWYRNLVEQDYDRAMEAFEIARGDLAHNSDLLSGIALLQKRQGKWDESLASSRRAQELDPRSPDRNRWLANTYMHMRRYEEAEYFMDRAISLDPENRQAYWEKASLFLLVGDTASARGVITEASRHIARTDAMWNSRLFGLWGLGHWRFGLIDEDPARLQREFAETFSERNRRIYFFCMGQLYDLSDKPDSARVFYDSARVSAEEELTRSPEDFHTQADLGLACALLGMRERAIHEMQTAKEMMPIRACHW